MVKGIRGLPCQKVFACLDWLAGRFNTKFYKFYQGPVDKSGPRFDVFESNLVSFKSFFGISM